MAWAMAGPIAGRRSALRAAGDVGGPQQARKRSQVLAPVVLVRWARRPITFPQLLGNGHECSATGVCGWVSAPLLLICCGTAALATVIP